MPTYDYECDACEHTFEEFQAMTDKPLIVCPKCGKKKLRRLFGTGSAVLFKGSGFYETDYRSESYKAGEKADKEKTSTADTSKKETKDAPAKGTTDTAAPKEAAANGKPREKTSKSRG
jgi:putative FmdB family regulatory protein